MNHDKNDAYFDLAQARNLSRGLRGQHESGLQLPRFSRFRVGSVAAPETEQPIFGSAQWNNLLDECLQFMSAHSGFVMDDQGLVVAARGRTAADEAQALGARMMITHDQAAQMSEARTGSVCVEIGSDWLCGLRFPYQQRNLSLCLIGAQPWSRVARQRVEQVLQAARLVDAANARTEEQPITIESTRSS